ncbi:MAG: hypothetical protein DI539_24785 [Flavobacterium psychrophilum]|nr:MAG: hypothetical protein DI539_24785 [Flavobacterium psychrophilum]
MSIGKLLCLSAMVIGSLTGYGQDHSSILTQWKSQQTTNPDNSIVAESTTLLLKGREKLEWKNSNGTIRRTFDVIEIVGVQPQKEGDKMRLEVVETGKRGYVLITLTGALLTAELSINYQQPQVYKLALIKS